MANSAKMVKLIEIFGATVVVYVAEQIVIFWREPHTALVELGNVPKL